MKALITNTLGSGHTELNNEGLAPGIRRSRSTAELPNPGMLCILEDPKWVIGTPRYLLL